MQNFLPKNLSKISHRFMKPISLIMFALFFVGSMAYSQSTGINYKYYEGNWGALPDFNSLTPSKSGVVNYFNLDPRGRESNYAFLWQGYITIPTTGTYTFETISDDGSKLFIGDYGYNTTPLVNNDGSHGNVSRTGTINLNAGVYPIALAYFQGSGDQTWEVYWSSNTGIQRQKIPNNVLSPATSGSGTSGTQGLTYNYYEGNWSALPDFNAISPKKSGVVGNANLDPRERETNYALLWKGYITIPSSGTYTFETLSDDGSKLYIGQYGYNTTPLINNDGLHGIQSRSASINLNAGVYPIVMSYLQSSGGQAWLVYWSSNTGISKQQIPNNVFSTDQSVAVTPQPNDPPTNEPTNDQPTGPDTNPSGSGGLTGSTNYYFSSSSGDDNRSFSQAQNPNTPWRTLGKLKSISSSLKAGDAVLFNRGEVFEGALTIARSGYSGTPVIYSSYGNGTKPVISGSINLSSWTFLGNNLWEANCPSNNTISMVTFNGEVQTMGRYPNINESNKGYLTLDSYYSNWQITDYQLSGSPNWTGAEVVIRKTNWVLDRGLVTNHSGNTINYNSPTAHEPTNGYGYFFQNSPLTLDQNGEWYFNPSSKRLRVYSTNNPNSINIKASVVDDLAFVDNKNNITFDNLSFQGGDLNAVKIQNSQNIKVQNCDVNFSGTQGISGSNASNVVVENTSFNNTNNDAIEFYNTSYTTLKNNIIQNTGLRPGMGLSNNQQYEAIFIEGTNNTVEANQVWNTGYSGITFAGEGALLKNNFVNYFCLTLDDGGGIYGWGDLDKYNRKVTGNIILNGIGAYEGTIYPFSTGASGILIDDRTAHIEFRDNTIANCSRNGIYLHNSRDMSVIGNTIFNNRIQIGLVHDLIAPDVPIRGMTVNENIVVSKTPAQFILETGSLTNDIASFGSMNYNYYARPVDQNGIISSNYKGSNGQALWSYFDLPGWAAQYGFDRNSQGSAVKVLPYQVTGYNGGNRFANGSFNSNINGVSCQSAPGRCNASWTNGRIDGGGVQVTYEQVNGSTNDVGMYVNLGSVQAGRHYLIKFSLLGANSAKTIKAFLLQDGGSYGRLSETRYFELTTTRKDHEFLFSPNSNENGVIIAFEVKGTDIPLWMDNFQMYDVNAYPTNLDEAIHLEYNATGSYKNISLNGSYVDVKNNKYDGNINLAPYSSAVLIKQSLTASVDMTANRAIEEAEIRIADADALALKVTPNPAVNNLQVFINASPEGQKSSMSVQTISGATLKTVSLNGSAQVVKVDVATWPKGVYLVNLYRGGRVISKKFVKQ